MKFVKQAAKVFLILCLLKFYDCKHKEGNINNSYELCCFNVSIFSLLWIVVCIYFSYGHNRNIINFTIDSSNKTHLGAMKIWNLITIRTLSVNCVYRFFLFPTKKWTLSYEFENCEHFEVCLLIGKILKLDGQTKFQSSMQF